MRSRTGTIGKRERGDLSVSVREHKGWHLIVLSGKFVVKTISLVRKAFESLQSRKVLYIALDLTGVTQIDSSSLTVMLNLQKRIQQKSGRMALIGPNEVIKETLFMVGFNKAVPMYNTQDEFEHTICPQ
jgi:anti-anti-sigma factor